MMIQLRSFSHQVLLTLTILFKSIPLFSDALLLQDIAIADLLATNNDISYIKCDNPIPFNYQPFPFMVHTHLHPHCGSFAETFILKIKNGIARSNYGLVSVDDRYFISEFNWKSLFHHHHLVEQVAPENIKKIPGRVLVLGQLGYYQYWHWVSEILARLAMTEQQGAEYDWIYVENNAQFMQETLELWGIDPSKIITPSGEHYAICADELIVPSLVSNLHYGFAPYSCYPSHHLFDFVAPKLQAAALAKQDQFNSRSTIPDPIRDPSTSNFQRIFISRQDAPGRFVENEDEVFALFEKRGFVRFQLSHLSIAQQIQLFSQVEMVAGAAGTGITANSLYCKPGTTVIELFQALGDSTMWFVSQRCGLNWVGVQTTDFAWDYQGCFGSTNMPLSQIERVLVDLDSGSMQQYYLMQII